MKTIHTTIFLTLLGITATLGLLLPQSTLAAPTPTKEVKANYTLYTYTSTCTDADGVFPGKDKKVGIVIPSSTPHMDTTYIFFHGSDEKTVAEICDGSRYKICESAVAFGSPMIIPRVAVQGSSTKNRISHAEFTCVINEANAVMASSTPPVGLATQQYVVAGHSSGAFTMSSYFLANLTATKAIVLDGCYIGGPKTAAAPQGTINFCQEIMSTYRGPIDFYYQAQSSSGMTAGTGVETLKASKIPHLTGAVTVKNVNLGHYELATACLKDTTGTCGNRIIETKETDPASESGSGTSGGTKAKTPSGNNNQISTVSLVNPIGSTISTPKGTTDIRVIFGYAVKKILGIIGAITFVVFIIGGAYWLISAGNAEMVKKGTETMIWAAIGLFVVFGAYGILSAVIGGLTGRAPLDRGPLSTQGADTQSGAYYKAGAADVRIFSEKKSNSAASGIITAHVTCILSPNGASDGFVSVVDPKNASLQGWVVEDTVSVMTATEVTKAGCGSPSANIEYHCVCTITDDQNGNTSKTAVPDVYSVSECTGTSVQSPVVGTSVSDCSWQAID